LVNGLTNKELQELFVKLGEERYARSIASHIVEYRKEKLITTTGELVSLVRQSVPNIKMNVHPATRVFQALRIAVNDELNNLREVLPKAVELLEKEGRLVVISFHSLEDRIVKQAFIALEKEGIGKIITKRPIEATEEETEKNRRSRSAKMRVFEKI
jgi:16S rRNA (cytosine1402-N4)-methyltransferase